MTRSARGASFVAFLLAVACNAPASGEDAAGIALDAGLRPDAAPSTADSAAPRADVPTPQDGAPVALPAKKT